MKGLGEIDYSLARGLRGWMGRGDSLLTLFSIAGRGQWVTELFLTTRAMGLRGLCSLRGDLRCSTGVSILLYQTPRPQSAFQAE